MCTVKYYCAYHTPGKTLTAHVLTDDGEEIPMVPERVAAARQNLRSRQIERQESGLGYDL